MPACVYSAALHGIDAIPVDVEVDVLAGLPSFTVVGLTDRSIQESKERLTAALSNTGYEPPRRKTIVSLAPASLRKEGSMYDLAIALGFLSASGQVEISTGDFKNSWLIGELGLDGSVRATRGVMPIAAAAVRYGIKCLYIPAQNAPEAAAMADQIKIYPVQSLPQLIDHLTADSATAGLIKHLEPADFIAEDLPAEIDMNEIVGQDLAKRALAVCAAGNHNALMIGPPGTGKTLLAKALVGILPALRKEEAMTVTSLHSVAGLLPAGQGLISSRPFRSPHHGASSVSLVGGGTNPKPGEVSLAHHGVLFLDELPEFSKSVLDQLRQPIEDGWVTVSRAASTVRYPARSMVIGAMNPCPCGYIGSKRRQCVCTAADTVRYRKKISGPLLDRFDLHVLVGDVPVSDLLGGKQAGPSSADYAGQVSAARQRQWRRQNKTNAELSPGEVKEYCVLDDRGRRMLELAQDKFRLSARGIHRLMKVALTIADLEISDRLTHQHLAEALQYREQLQAALPDFA